MTIVTVQAEELRLLPERAIWWRAKETLFVADVHLGKAETFQHHSIPLPGGISENDLMRLTQLIKRMKAKRLVILGDWLHSRVGTNQNIIAAVTNWRKQHQELRIFWMKGNHDYQMDAVPQDWKFDLVSDSILEQPFVFQHEPAVSPDGYVLSGHIHPGYALRGKGKQRLDLPCFWIRQAYLVLPSFSPFTGAALVQPAEDDQVFVVTASEVMQVR